MVVNLRLRTEAARLAGVDGHVCELQLTPRTFAEAAVTRAPRTTASCLPVTLSGTVRGPFSSQTHRSSRRHRATCRPSSAYSATLVLPPR